MTITPRIAHLPDHLALRPLTAADADELAPLNDAAAPAVPVTSVADLAQLIEHAELALGVHAAGKLVGFVIAIAPGADYDSENYRHFESRGIDHLYVDRIVIAETERGSGLGAVLYAQVFDAARQAARQEVTCEVNLDPPNPRSLAFHERLGFRPVGTLATKGGAVTVTLLAAPIEMAPIETAPTEQGLTS
ncbi:MAG: GNAT family N-acetyltransferase [Microcella sp.]|nr:GNAT family N-acetyltransferase [Microcella sp.]